LNIRRALSETELKSSCFVVETELGEMGNPVSVTLRGAGWGHGVGMCQYGAAAMAMERKTHQDILGHYYPGSSIITLYDLDPEIKPKTTKKKTAH
jgi:stage II sporulation protein D